MLLSDILPSDRLSLLLSTFRCVFGIVISLLSLREYSDIDPPLYPLTPTTPALQRRLLNRALRNCWKIALAV